MIEALIIIVLVVLAIVFHALVWSTFIGLSVLFLIGWHWVLTHLWLVVGYAAGYVLVGGVWSIIKWWWEEIDRVQRAKDLYTAAQGGSGRYWGEVKEGESLQAFLDRRKSDPSKHGHREDIITWIVFWPFNLLWTLLNDPLVRAAKRIWAELQGVYRRISDRVWRA